MEVFGGILSGGSGTRFWPLSRKENPKQFLNLSGKDALLRETVHRLSGLIETEKLYVLTSAPLKNRSEEILKDLLPKRQVFIEPSAQGTAAAIGYFALQMMSLSKDALLVLLPSDAYIYPTQGFQKTLGLAVKSAKDNLVTIGIPPSFPATGYGYIERGEAEDGLFRVTAFHEKPDERTAKEYLSRGNFYWNSGILIGRADVLLLEIRRYMPELFEGLERIKTYLGKDDGKAEKIYQTLPKTSIDYGVLEKSDRIRMIPAEFTWNDVGSLDMLGVFHPKDSSGNIKVGDCLAYESKNNVVYAEHRTVVLYGVEGLIVAETPDAILVVRREDAQSVGKLTERLARDGYSFLL